jgi:hypothetical protein
VPGAVTPAAGAAAPGAALDVGQAAVDDGQQGVAGAVADLRGAGEGVADGQGVERREHGEDAGAQAPVVVAALAEVEVARAGRVHAVGADPPQMVEHPRPKAGGRPGAESRQLGGVEEEPGVLAGRRRPHRRRHGRTPRATAAAPRPTAAHRAVGKGPPEPS